MPKFGWAGWRWMKFLDKLGNSGRMILIAHEDCRWYSEALQAPGRDRQLSDLREIRAGLRQRFAPASVEMYYARLGTPGNGTFEAV